MENRVGILLVIASNTPTARLFEAAGLLVLSVL